MYKKTLFVLVGVLCLFAFTGCGSSSGSLSCEKSLLMKTDIKLLILLMLLTKITRLRMWKISI